MRRTISILLAGLGFASASELHADHWGWNMPPVRMDFVHRFDIKVGAAARGPIDLPPWWTFFPYDPNTQIPQGTTAYPPWQAAPPGYQGHAYYPRPMVYPTQPAGYYVPNMSYPPGAVPGYWPGR